jgi:hypothetical protein
MSVGQTDLEDAAASLLRFAFGLLQFDARIAAAACAEEIYVNLLWTTFRDIARNASSILSPDHADVKKSSVPFGLGQVFGVV